MLLALSIFVGCNTDNIKYTIIVLSDNEAYGMAYGGGEFSEGNEVTINAVAKDGYGFIGWYINDEKVENADSEYKFNAVRNVTIKAKFNTIEEIAIAELDFAKSTVITGLQTYVDTFDLDLYDESGIASIQAILESTIVEVNQCETVDAVTILYLEFKGLIDNVKTLAIKLEEAIANAKGNIDTYFDEIDLSLYDDAGVEAISSAVLVGKTRIEEAITLDAVDSAFKTTKLSIESILTISEKALRSAKATASDDLKNVVNLLDLNSYDVNDADAINKILNDALIAISNASTVDEVNEVWDAAKVQITKIADTPLEKVRTDAIDHLEQYSSIITNTSLSQDQIDTISEFVESGSAEIRDSNSVYDINKYVDDTISAIDLIFEKVLNAKYLEANATENKSMNGYDEGSEYCEAIDDFVISAIQRLNQTLTHDELTSTYLQIEVELNLIIYKIESIKTAQRYVDIALYSYLKMDIYDDNIYTRELSNIKLNVKNELNTIYNTREDIDDSFAEYNSLVNLVILNFEKQNAINTLTEYVTNLIEMYNLDQFIFLIQSIRELESECINNIKGTNSEAELSSEIDISTAKIDLIITKHNAKTTLVEFATKVKTNITNSDQANEYEAIDLIIKVANDNIDNATTDTEIIDFIDVAKTDIDLIALKSMAKYEITEYASQTKTNKNYPYESIESESIDACVLEWYVNIEAASSGEDVDLNITKSTDAIDLVVAKIEAKIRVDIYIKQILINNNYLEDSFEKNTINERAQLYITRYIDDQSNIKYINPGYTYVVDEIDLTVLRIDAINLLRSENASIKSTNNIESNTLYDTFLDGEEASGVNRILDQDTQKAINSVLNETIQKLYEILLGYKISNATEEINDYVDDIIQDLSGVDYDVYDLINERRVIHDEINNSKTEDEVEANLFTGKASLDFIVSKIRAKDTLQNAAKDTKNTNESEGGDYSNELEIDDATQGYKGRIDNAITQDEINDILSEAYDTYNFILSKIIIQKQLTAAAIDLKSDFTVIDWAYFYIDDIVQNAKDIYIYQAKTTEELNEGYTKALAEINDEFDILEIKINTTDQLNSYVISAIDENQDINIDSKYELYYLVMDAHELAEIEIINKHNESDVLSEFQKFVIQIDEIILLMMIHHSLNTLKNTYTDISIKEWIIDNPDALSELDNIYEMGTMSITCARSQSELIKTEELILTAISTVSIKYQRLYQVSLDNQI
jgi:predicted transcriptional regulator with HTH domain